MKHALIEQQESPVSNELIKLLECWGIHVSTGGDKAMVAWLTGQINSSPGGQLCKDAANKAPEYELNETPRYQIPYSENGLQYVNDLIREQRPKVRDTLHYKYVRYKTGIKYKCKELHIDPSTFHRRLDRAHKVIDAAIDWSLTK
ncbi:MAG: hypothetical protein GY774_04385 [Planctomycetes bacterium]|nr:hypothetical protein [Planctomycetota bacterium]